MSATVLAINSGSSSIKFSVYQASSGRDLTLQIKGQVEAIRTQPRLRARDASGAPLMDRSYPVSEISDQADALRAVSTWLREREGLGPLLVAGHRVAHGGPSFTEPVLVDGPTIASLEELIPLAPLHQPVNLAGIKALQALRPDLPQVACFDTAFHRGHSEIVDRFALPAQFYRQGIRRYGFHGLSYEYITGRLPNVAPDIAAEKVIVAHLGSGASLCAIHRGRSIDTTMSFTALDGLPMATRCGQLDPGVVIYLLREKGMTASEIERLLYNESGLQGLSDISGDTRDLFASDKPDAKMALEYFAYHVARQIAALAAALEGLDGLVFTAGIGENSPALRDWICARLGWLGLRLDPEANAAGGPRISADGSAISAWVVPTDEELIIARHALDVVSRRKPEILPWP